jgi:hypothetical protein
MRQSLIARIYATILLLSTTNAIAQDRPNQNIDCSKAVEIAQAFIASNGYTDLPATADKSKLAFETIERTSNSNKILKRRYNTIERKAYGIIHRRRGGSPGWTVVFLYKRNIRGVGRVVTMDEDGSRIRVEHVAYKLSSIEKRSCN